MQAMDSRVRPPLKVFLVEDSPLLRTRVEAMIAGIPGAQLAGHAAEEDAAVEGILAAGADAVVLDLHLAKGTGFDVLRRVMAKAPGTRVYVLTNYPTEAHRNTAARLGALAFFDKSHEFDRLLGSLTAAAA